MQNSNLVQGQRPAKSREVRVNDPVLSAPLQPLESKGWWFPAFFFPQLWAGGHGPADLPCMVCGLWKLRRLVTLHMGGRIRHLPWQLFHTSPDNSSLPKWPAVEGLGSCPIKWPGGWPHWTQAQEIGKCGYGRPSPLGPLCLWLLPAHLFPLVFLPLPQQS